jgi:phosphoribosylformylglycinamidine (FGAM) synthase PurS component
MELVNNLVIIKVINVDSGKCATVMLDTNKKKETEFEVYVICLQYVCNVSANQNVS